MFNQDEDEENNDSSRKLKLSLPSEEDKRVSFGHVKTKILFPFKTALCLILDVMALNSRKYSALSCATT